MALLKVISMEKEILLRNGGWGWLIENSDILYGPEINSSAWEILPTVE